MSFSPLPKTFLEDLSRGGRVVELGCGDGRFSALLAAAGAPPLRLDRLPPREGTVADVVADAAALPLAAGSVDLLVAANLLRHLGPAAGPVPADWLNCLRPRGALYIFEDEPAGHPAAARNYRDLQRFLARLSPGRGSLLPRARFARRLGPAAEGWLLGQGRNWYPADAGRVAAWLESMGGGPGGEAAGLAAAIRARGLDYGPYWWARYRSPGRDSA